MDSVRPGILALSQMKPLKVQTVALPPEVVVLFQLGKELHREKLR